MNKTLVAEIVCVSLFIGMSVLSVVFYRLGRGRLKDAEISAEVSNTITGSVFALLGLLLAFTFSGAYSRYEFRRDLIVREANAIESVYLRLDLLPPSFQAPLRANLRDYAVSRASLYGKLTDFEAARSEILKSVALEEEIWERAVAATADPANRHLRLLLLPVIDEMFDMVTNRTVAIQSHPPQAVWVLLVSIALICAGLTGYRAAASERPAYSFHFLLAAVIAAVLYVILDIEHPRFGLVRLDAVNQLLVSLADTMK